MIIVINDTRGDNGDSGKKSIDTLIFRIQSD